MPLHVLIEMFPANRLNLEEKARSAGFDFCAPGFALMQINNIIMDLHKMN